MENNHKEFIGWHVKAGGELKRISGIITDIEIDDDGHVWYIVTSDNNEKSKWGFYELTFIPTPDRQETYEEKIEHFQKLSGWNKEDSEKFIELVSKYLDSCGYFMGDFNIHNLPIPIDWIPYSKRDFGTWLLDMALQYNMEQGMEYECKFKLDRRKTIPKKY